MGNGLYTSLVVFFLTIAIFDSHAFRPSGQVADMYVMGTIMFTCIIWAVNCQITLTMSHFTWIQHVLVWGSIAMWYVFITIYGALPLDISGNVYQQFVEILAPATIYWTTTVLVTVLCVGPYFIHMAIQRALNPLDHHIIQEIKYYRKDVEDQTMWHREQSKARTRTKIGFSARVEAKMRQLKTRIQKKQSGSTFPSPASLKS